MQTAHRVEPTNSISWNRTNYCSTYCRTVITSQRMVLETTKAENEDQGVNNPREIEEKHNGIEEKKAAVKSKRIKADVNR